MVLRLVVSRAKPSDASDEILKLDMAYNVEFIQFGHYYLE